MHNENSENSALIALGKQAVRCLNKLPAAAKNQFEGKYYYAAAQAVVYLQADKSDAARACLEKACKILSRGIPHPKGVIAMGLDICSEIDQRFKRR